MAKGKPKTNAMRILEREKIVYTAHFYESGDGAIDGVSVAGKLGQEPDTVFKTLVCTGHSGGVLVYVIPVAEELDLKAAARAAGEKSCEMAPLKNLLALTGYVRGGCSPIGMKKPYPTVVDERCLAHETICFSGGKVGCQIECAPQDLLTVTGGKTANLCK